MKRVLGFLEGGNGRVLGWGERKGVFWRGERVKKKKKAWISSGCGATCFSTFPPNCRKITSKHSLQAWFFRKTSVENRDDDCIPLISQEPSLLGEGEKGHHKKKDVN